jgi:hypothetical protein
VLEDPLGAVARFVTTVPFCTHGETRKPGVHAQTIENEWLAGFHAGGAPRLSAMHAGGGTIVDAAGSSWVNSAVLAHSAGFFRIAGKPRR